MKTPYNQGYYNLQQDGSYKSAMEVIPLVLQLLKVNSVVDVGCGVGAWLQAFKELGVPEIYGLDGTYIKPEMLRIPKENFHPSDLNKDIQINKTFDLAVSMEVAEHLPKSSAETFVNSLVNLAPVILFSAAIPFQASKKVHLNEQWPEYWVNLFEKHGYVVIDPLRKLVWNNMNVEWWYAQNVLIFVKKDLLSNYPKLQEEYSKTNFNQLALVHPRSLSLYTIRNAAPTLLKEGLTRKFKKFIKSK